MDFRSEVFKLCKAIQKRTETNIVNDTYLRLFTCKSEEYVIPQYSMFHEAAKHGNNQFYGYLYANEHTDDYKTVLQGLHHYLIRTYRYLQEHMPLFTLL